MPVSVLKRRVQKKIPMRIPGRSRLTALL